MTNKDFVKMEQKICPLCGVTHTHDTGILMHKQMRNIKDEDTITGYGLCEEHDKLHEDGFIALVECENPQDDSRTHLKMGEANRTGRFIHIKRKVLREMIDIEVPDKLPMMFTTVEVIDNFISMNQEAE